MSDGRNEDSVSSEYAAEPFEYESVNAEDLQPILLSAASKPPASYVKKQPDAQPVYVIDFFAGCGGMSYGFLNTRQSHATFKVMAGIDIDDEALKTYARNIVGAMAVNADVARIGESPNTLTELVPGFDPAVCRPLVFIGCAPCQGFSAHRKKDERDDPRNSLMVAFAKICDAFKPDAIVMENVPEILGGRYSEYFQAAAGILTGAGYTLEKDVLDLSLYGVPQRRRRAIVLGSLSGNIPLPQAVFTKESALTVRHAIAHLAPIESGVADPDDPFHRAPQHTARILERIRKTPPDGGDRRSLAQNEQLDCHTNIDGGATPGFTDVYGRLRWETPSVTITAKSSTPSCGRFLHPEQHRNISVREAAILQGFPQSYIFEGPFIRQYRQVGEAVPPLFARFLARQVLEHLFPPMPRKLPALLELSAGRSTAAVQEEAIAIVDGFCGAGGIGLGFMAAGYSNAYAFDIDADAVATFSKNISSKVEQRDVTDPTLASRINAAVANAEFVIAGGAPCQGFSQQRRGNDEDARNNLVLRYADLVASLARRPLAILLENVTYLDSPRGREVFASYIKKVEGLGYTVFRHDLNSADYNVPQLRRRIIVVAIRLDVAIHYRGPSPLTGGSWPTVGRVLGSLSNTPAGIGAPTLANHDPSAEGDLNKRRIAFVDMGSGRMAIPPSLQLACHLKYGGHLDVYGRLDWFSQARTITGGFDSFTRGEYAHPFFHRSITAREAARIQGFPDWFAFDGKRAAVRQQIGNAVPPPVAYAVAKAVKDAVLLSRRGH